MPQIGHTSELGISNQQFEKYTGFADVDDWMKRVGFSISTEKTFHSFREHSIKILGHERLTLIDNEIVLIKRIKHPLDLVVSDHIEKKSDAITLQEQCDSIASGTELKINCQTPIMLLNSWVSDMKNESRVILSVNSPHPQILLPKSPNTNEYWNIHFPVGGMKYTSFELDPRRESMMYETMAVMKNPLTAMRFVDYITMFRSLARQRSP